MELRERVKEKNDTASTISQSITSVKLKDMYLKMLKNGGWEVKSHKGE
jgi:hypothetical protein